ncbi:MAG TPA: response regulator [Stellaceae bacterium]|nr:response regulator [Stellaceae bacterium]
MHDDDISQPSQPWPFGPPSEDRGRRLMTATLRGLKVLIVEDEYLIASLIEQMLEAAGCVISGSIPRVAEAIEAARETECDVALLDVNLVGKQVYQVAEQLAERGIPFLFLSGYAQDVLPSGFAERPWLRKPFKRSELYQALSNLIEQRAPVDLKSSLYAPPARPASI